MKAIVLGCVLCLGACRPEENFALGLRLDACESTLPSVCGVTPRCVVEPEEYLNGKFPGERRFVVRTEGEATVELQILLTALKASGSELLVNVYESNCSEIHRYDSGGRDVLRLSDANGVIKIPLHVVRAGDHPVEIVSDVYADFAIKHEVQRAADSPQP